MKDKIFLSVEESLAKYISGEECNTGFAYYFDCECTELEDVHTPQDLEALKNDEECKICIVHKDAPEPYAEFSRAICPAYLA